MANEVTGKTLKFLFGGIEKSVKSVKNDESFALLPTTSSANSADGKSSVAGRYTGKLSVEANLYMPDGAEVATGNCTAGTKYRVSLGTVGTHAVGTIFTADGTEALSAPNKVKPLGAEITGKTLGLTIGGSTFKVKTLDYTKQYDEFNKTTSSTAADFTETMGLRAGITSKISALMYSDTADKIAAVAPASQALVVTLATGVTITGNGILHQISTSQEVMGAVQVDYTIEWQDIPVEVGLSEFAMNTESAFVWIQATGASTNKQTAGNAICLQKTYSADVNGEVKATYSLNINGAITKAVAN